VISPKFFEELANFEISKPPIVSNILVHGGLMGQTRSKNPKSASRKTRSPKDQKTPTTLVKMVGKQLGEFRENATEFLSEIVGPRMMLVLQFTSRFEVRPADDGWMICQRGSTLPLRVFKKKGDALSEAKKMAKSLHVGVNVFGRDGDLQSRLSFG
jgi:hypothetical protein